MATSMSDIRAPSKPTADISLPLTTESPPVGTTTSSVSRGVGAATSARTELKSDDIVWRWVDGVMKREGGTAAAGWTRNRGLSDPSEGFTDGLRLIRLIEVLSGHKCPTPYHITPTGMDEYNSIDNLRMAFRMLRAEGIEPGFKPEYLYHKGSQRLHLLTDLLWRVMLHFRVYRHLPDASGASGSDEQRLNLIKSRLLYWVKDKTARHSDTFRLRLEDLEHGFDDGYVYLILLHEYDPSMVTAEDLRHYGLPTQRSNALATTTSLAKRHLGIPKIVSTHTGASGFSDERANLAYLSEFWWRFYQRDEQQQLGGGGALPRTTTTTTEAPSGLSYSRGEREREREPIRTGESTRSPERPRFGVEEERLRADQLRLRAETDRKRADEERLKALEARTRAEQDKSLAEEDVQRAMVGRQKAESEARRALERREVALREKERLDEEKRRAEDERRYAMESIRRSEVERLKIEQERKRLEDEVRRAEDERLRTISLSKKAEEDRRRRDTAESERAKVDEIRRYTQLRMEEAERERAHAAEERRLAREEMLMAEHERRLAEEERRRAEIEKHLAEEERMRAEREKQLLFDEEDRRREYYPRYAEPSPLSQQPRVEVIKPLPAVPVVTRVVQPVAQPVSPAVVATAVPVATVVPATTTTTTTTTTAQIDLEEKKRRKAEKRARKAEDLSKRKEKLRRKEEKKRLRAEAEKKRLEEYIAMTSSVFVGVLHLSVVEARGLGHGIHGPYAKVYLERQKMKTTTIKKTLMPQWRSDFKLYHSDPDANLEVRVYDRGGRFGAKRFIGRVEVNLRDLSDGTEEDTWYPLHYKPSAEEKLRRKEKRKREKERYKGWVPEEVRAWRGDEPLGEVHLKMLYRKDPLYTKAGIASK